MGTIVSLVKSTDSYSGVGDCLIPLADRLAARFSEVPLVVIKINMVISATPAYPAGVPLATTPRDAVRRFVDFIRPFYAGKIVLAEQSAWGDTKQGFSMYGFAELTEYYPQMTLLDIGDDDTCMHRIGYPAGELELPFSKAIQEAPFLVSIVRPKTHCTVGMTAAVKNVLIGAIQKHSMKKKTHRGVHIHPIMASISDVVYPDFAIVDGTIGMEGGGPVRGSPIEAGWVAASFDALALDTLTTHLMGVDAADIGYLSLLTKKGKGLAYPSSSIEVLGENPERLVTPFRLHRSFKKVRHWRQES